MGEVIGLQLKAGIYQRKKLYSIYSDNEEKRTFIDYAKNAKKILKLNDQETDSLIKYHKRKIAMAIKEGQKK